MTDQKLKVAALQLAVHATMNSGGTLEKAKEFYSWLSNEEGDRVKEQDKQLSEFPTWSIYECLRAQNKESAASNPDNFVQPQTNSVPDEGANPEKVFYTPKHSQAIKEAGKRCGSMHYDEQIRLENEEKSSTESILFVDELPIKIQIGSHILEIRQK